jgi:uncharacterized beta-barrel protein YwiB (DUF1934 family)
MSINNYRAMKNTFISFVFLVFPLSAALAQSDSTDVRKTTIKWSVEEVQNLATHAYATMNCSFTTHADKKIIWNQSNGKLTYEMTIERIQGEWKDVNQPGSLQYAVELKGTKGKIIITRDGDWVTLKMDFKRGNGSDMNYEFIISNFQLQ